MISTFSFIICRFRRQTCELPTSAYSFFSSLIFGKLKKLAKNLSVCSYRRLNYNRVAAFEFIPWILQAFKLSIVNILNLRSTSLIWLETREGTLHKICVNATFCWPVFSRKKTRSKIKSFEGKYIQQEHGLTHIVCSV